MDISKNKKNYENNMKAANSVLLDIISNMQSSHFHDFLRFIILILMIIVSESIF